MPPHTQTWKDRALSRPEPRRLSRVPLVTAFLAVLFLVTACSGGNGSQKELLVFAASSLTDAMTGIAAAFEAANDGAKVSLNFASSSALATQIVEGAPAAVFASANEAQMQRVMETGLAGEARIFATNRLVVVVPASGSPVRSFADLARPGIKLVLAAREVPVGAYSRQFIASYDETNQGYRDAALANVVSEEPNVRAVLAKVQLGEADAGIVYETDVAVAQADVQTFSIPDEFNVIASYPIAALVDAEQGGLASRFVDFVLGAEGQTVLSSYGFGPPPGQQQRAP